MSKEEAKKMRKGYFVLVFCLIVAILFTVLVLRTYNISSTTIEQPLVKEETSGVPSSESMHAMLIAINDLKVSVDQLREELIQLKADADKPEAEPQSMEALCWNYVNDITTNYYPDVDPNYVYAIISHESRFQSDAVNKKTGVVGLMQINPKWHSKRANDLGVMDLKDPYGNILVGCDILHEVSQGKSFEYALNFFAGGYPYANRYQSKTSPYIASLNHIMESNEFSALKGGV